MLVLELALIITSWWWCADPVRCVCPFPVVQWQLASQNPSQLIPYLAVLRQRLEELKPGQFLIQPGGWVTDKYMHNVMYVVERQEKVFRFVICNTGIGHEYHPSDAQDPPKLKSDCSACVPHAETHPSLGLQVQEQPCV